ncbi:unnamed protein product [Caenorhabditis sp. 36 PRJEB53466]|nr:unnamed protein product [Caenorhabditis sp. 36 PRJEB53466]
MTDSQSTQMGRKQARRNKSTASVGSKKTRSTSSSIIKFQPNVDGFSAFLVACARLGKNGHEFTWHDLRKVYHRETQRQLTVEELNALFSTRNLTKKQVFEMPTVKRFIESMDGSMMCRFRLIGDPEEYNFDEIPPLMTTSMESDVVTQSAPSTDQSHAVSPVPDGKSIAISTDCEAKAGPTSDLSKSETSPSQRSLSQQASVQSSMTDDEGWASGKEARSENSSPMVADEGKDEIDGKSQRKSIDLEDEVFEDELRIAAGSDQIDGAVISDVMFVDEARAEDVFRPSPPSRASPFLVTESIDAAFEAVVQTYVDAKKTLPETQNASEEAKVQATPRKVFPAPVAAERTKHSEELSSGPPIRHLIEKFDTGVNFSGHRTKTEESPSKSIYTQVLEEIGETEKQIEQVFVSPKKNQHEEAEVTNVIFRSTSTHSSIIAQGKEQLAAFVAEQEAKHRVNPEPTADTTTEETEAAFGVKEQSSLSSLDREYFDSKMVKNEDLFAELGVEDADGFQLQTTGSNNSSADITDKSGSNDTPPESAEIITVIEKSAHQKVLDELRNGADSIESDADVPYSLCSEDEAEPMTMIDKSMNVSQSAEQLTAPKEDHKTRTVVINVELDANAKREISVDVNNTSVKERIAALQAVVSKKKVPIAKVDSVDEKEEMMVLNRTEDLEQSVLEVRPQSNVINSDGSIRRRQVRFMRGCCVVQ